MEEDERGDGDETEGTEGESTVDDGEGRELDEGVDLGNDVVETADDENPEGDNDEEEVEEEIGDVVGSGEGQAVEGETPNVFVEGETPVEFVEGKTLVASDEGETPVVHPNEEILMDVVGGSPVNDEEIVPLENVDEVVEEDDAENAEQQELEVEGPKEIVNLDDGSDEEETPVNDRATR